MTDRVWFVCWSCRCCATNPDRDALPETCPGHGKHRIGRPEQLTPLPEYSCGHFCDDDNPCPEEP